MNDLTVKERARIRVAEFINTYSGDMDSLDDLLDELEMMFNDEYYFKRIRSRD